MSIFYYLKFHARFRIAKRVRATNHQRKIMVDYMEINKELARDEIQDEGKKEYMFKMLANKLNAVAKQKKTFDVWMKVRFLNINIKFFKSLFSLFFSIIIILI